MDIQKDCVVTVQYTLSVPLESNEEIVEKTTAQNPFRFVFGAGLMLEAFEKALLGKKKSDPFEVRIACKDAYQEPQEDLIIKVEKRIFEDEKGVFSKEVVKDAVVNLEDEDGNVVPAVVLHVDAAKDGQVEVDMNHPLAGYDLHFVGYIEDVRPATEAEKNNPEILMDPSFLDDDSDE